MSGALINTQNAYECWDKLVSDYNLSAADINGLVDDHRTLKANSKGLMFAAIAGAMFDPREYLNDIIDCKPSAVLIDNVGDWVIPENINARFIAENIPCISMSNLRNNVGYLAHQAYGKPSEKMKLVAVTGTNGKTSIVYALAQALNYLNENCGMIGTLGSGLLHDLVDTGMTTPSAAVFQYHLSQMVKADSKYCACEVTSIALDQGRVNGSHFFSAIFTNLSHDHLDYHQDIASYGNAKASLFQDYPLEHAIINVDDEFGKTLTSSTKRAKYCWALQSTKNINTDTRADNIWLYSGDSPHDFLLVPAAQASIIIHEDWQNPAEKGFSFSAPWVGAHNTENLALVVINLALLGFSVNAIQKALLHLPTPTGRLEKVCLSDKPDINLPSVWVDFAHTPDALKKSLIVLAKEAKEKNGKLWCVFGCGGNRDRGKRALMGNIALKFADHIIATSDNPRNEEPTLILTEIYPKALPNVVMEVDRKKAIFRAIDSAKNSDVILIAGKGHEQYQEITGKRTFFSDQQVVKNALTKRAKS